MSNRTSTRRTMNGGDVSAGADAIAAAGLAMVPCPQCNRIVQERNLQIHELTACAGAAAAAAAAGGGGGGGGRRRERQTLPTMTTMSTTTNEAEPMEICDVEEDSSDPAALATAATVVVAAPAPAAAPAPRRRRHVLRAASTPSIMEIDDDDVVVEEISSSSAGGVNGGGESRKHGARNHARSQLGLAGLRRRRHMARSGSSGGSGGSGSSSGGSTLSSSSSSPPSQPSAIRRQQSEKSSPSGSAWQDGTRGLRFPGDGHAAREEPAQGHERGHERPRGRLASTACASPRDPEDDDEDDDVMIVPPSSAQTENAPAVVDLSHEAPPDAPATTTATATTTEVSNDNWSCPRCTLDNPVTERRCDACGLQNPSSNRDADPVRRERLIHNDDVLFLGSNSTSPYSSNSGILAGSTLFGSLLGGAGAYMRGRPVSTGLLEGAMFGAMGGAAFEMTNEHRNNTNTNVHPSHPERPHSPFGVHPHSSTNGTAARAPHRPENNRHRRQHPRSSVRVVRMGNGRMSATVFSGDRTRRIVLPSGAGNGHGNENENGTATTTEIGSANADAIFALLMSGAMTGGPPLMGRHPGQNLDGMTYEQLLQAFGDGSENRGADESDISRLPTHTLTNIEKELPSESRQCLVCLEDFEVGNHRKTLPCLHGFHEDCIDKWLRTNGSCPICKHSLNG